jgi:hypothetical protein
MGPAALIACAVTLSGLCRKDRRGIRCSLGVTKRLPIRSYGTVVTTRPHKRRGLALKDQEEKGC